MRALVAVAILLLPVVATAQPDHVEEGWWTDVALDADHDGLDDSFATLPGDLPVVVLVDYARMPTPAQKDALRAAGFEIVREYEHFPILAVRAEPARLPELRDAPGVVLVEKDDVIFPLLKESVGLVGAPQVWSQYGATGEGVTIAVLDDGAFEQHPDLQSRLAGHYDAGGPSQTSGAPVSVIAPAADSEGHGTHVAGIIVGSGAQSGGTYKGVAPDARFANVKVFSTAQSTSSSLVLAGLDWVISNRESLNIRIASMSLGGTPSDGKDAICRAVDLAVDKGLIVVASAGNAGPGKGTITAPGAAEKAITVGAVDKQKKIAPYSSRGPTIRSNMMKPDVMAPGSDIMSTVPPTQASGVGGLLGGGGSSAAFYGSLSGTSMAAPHVSGIVAMMLEVNPDLSPKEVKDILLATAARTQDLGAKGPDNETGYGFVNGVAAVQVAKNPAMLERPEFASILATIPDPAPESFFEKLSFEGETMLREGKLPLMLSLAAGAVGIVILAVVAVRAVRRR